MEVLFNCVGLVLAEGGGEGKESHAAPLGESVLEKSKRLLVDAVDRRNKVYDDLGAMEMPGVGKLTVKGKGWRGSEDVCYRVSLGAWRAARGRLECCFRRVLVGS